MKRRIQIPTLPHSITPILPVFLSATLLALTALSAPAAPLTLYAFEQPHMGTLFKIKLYAADEASGRRASTAAYDRIEALDQICSDYIPNSELKHLEASPPGKPIPISNDLFQVLEQSLRLARATGGAFDPTLGHYTNLWRRSTRKGILPTPEQLDAVRAKSGHQHLKLERIDNQPTATLLIAGLVLDLGGIAKGYAADEALATLEELGANRSAIAAGGDIRVGDPPPGTTGWEIPILAPDRETETYLTTVTLENAAASSSGNREQFVEIDGIAYSHIIDPRTGLGVTHPIAATVIARKGSLSDSHATAFCVLGPEEAIPFAESIPNLEALIVIPGKDGAAARQFTKQFPAK